jgi:hypothetical protein
MSIFKKHQWLLIASFITLFSSVINAHELTATKAQVILRDGQIEVRIITDIDHLITNLQNEQTWLMGDIDSVMPASLNTQAQEDFIKTALKQKLVLKVNNQLLAIERVSFTHAFKTHTDEHHAISNRREIVFFTQHPINQVTDLAISFHHSLGPIHLSFVKPQYKLLKAGQSAQVAF